MKELPQIRSIWDYSDAVSSARKFEELMTLAKKEGNTGYYLELKTQLATALGLQMQIDEAKSILDEVRQELPEGRTIAAIRYFLELGRVYNSGGNPEEATPHFTKAMKIAQELGEIGLEIDAIHMLGIAAPTPSKQIEWNQVALDKVEASSDTDLESWLGPLYNNTAWSLHDQGRIEEARDLFEKDYRYRMLKNYTEQALIALWSVARMERELGNIEKALELQKEVRDRREQAGLGIGGYNMEELGELYLLQKDVAISKDYFTKAYDILSKDQWLSRNEPERLKRLKDLANRLE